MHGALTAMTEVSARSTRGIRRASRRVSVRHFPLRHLVAVGLGSTLVSRPASAAPTPMALEGEAGVELGWIRTTPTLAFDDVVATPLRTLRAGQLGSAGPLTFLGGHFDTSIVAADQWVFPLVGAGAYWAVGDTPRTLTTLDGSFVELRPWTTHRIDVLLPGVGVRMKARRWAFAVTVRAAYTFLGMNAAIANGASTKVAEATASAPSLRMSVEACRRLDPTNRACLFVAPNLYEVSFLNGGSIGLRWEWGP